MSFKEFRSRLGSTKPTYAQEMAEIGRRPHSLELVLESLKGRGIASALEEVLLGREAVADLYAELDVAEDASPIITVRFHTTPHRFRSTPENTFAWYSRGFRIADKGGSVEIGYAYTPDARVLHGHPNGVISRDGLVSGVTNALQQSMPYPDQRIGHSVATLMGSSEGSPSSTQLVLRPQGASHLAPIYRVALG